MNKNIKKIVAREGLTILTLVLAGTLFWGLGLFFYHNPILPFQKKITKYEVELDDGRKFEFEADTQPSNDEIAQYINQQQGQHQPDLSKLSDQELLSLEQQQGGQGTSFRSPESAPLQQPFATALLIIAGIIFIAVYPLILIFRFVIWAIKTLKEK
ncbi:MAG: hypothetical protein ABIH85_00130 [Candidatus Omnitrophota bacterium]